MPLNSRGDALAYWSTMRGEIHSKTEHFHLHFLQKVLFYSSIALNPPCRRCPKHRLPSFNMLGSKVLNLNAYLLQQGFK